MITIFKLIDFISVLRMREKAISGMMIAVHRRDTDVEERLRREGVER